MGMSVGGGGSKVKAEPNVVPMIDIMLVILIIFMLIIPQMLSGFDATPPQGINLKQQKEEERDQTLGIDKDGRYYWNKQMIPNESLGDSVLRIFGARDPNDAGSFVLFVRADRELEYGKILDALDIAAKNKVAVAALISDQTPNTESTVASDIAAPPGAAPGGGQ